MYSLFLDTTQSYCNIAIFKKNRIVNRISIKTNNNLTDLVVEHISRLINKAKIKYSDIGSLYILNGPGSFTGVRVATLVAKTWYITKKINIYVMNSLEFQIPSSSGISILKATSNKSYVCVIENKKVLIKPCLFDNTELNAIKNKHKNLNVFEYFNEINVFDNLLKNINKFKRINNLNKLQPLYIKKPI